MEPKLADMKGARLSLVGKLQKVSILSLLLAPVSVCSNRFRWIVRTQGAFQIESCLVDA